MVIHGSFRFHAVGQGLFYTGLLTSGRSRRGVFSFVYDCGTRSSRQFLRREIEDFKSLLPHAGNGHTRRLNLLVVSHLHDDHVNGLDILLDGLEVDTVVMPYTNRMIRLLARAESAYEETFLRSFYADPIDWFSSRSVRRIMLVGSPAETNAADSLSFYQDEDNPLSFGGEGILSTGRLRNTSLVYLNNAGRAKSLPFQWRFRFNNLASPGRIPYLYTLEKYQREVMLSLDDIFRSRKLVKELAKRLRGSIPPGEAVNRTSVVLTHEPILYDGNTSTFWSPYSHLGADNFIECCHPRYLNPIDNASPLQYQTILTGDFEARDLAECRSLWDYKQRIGVFQYPHHGAKGTINFERPPHGWFKVFSAGIANGYGHPHPEALAEQGFPVIVDERNAFDYRIAIC